MSLLPNEIIHLIASFSNDKAAFKNYLNVCRRWHSILSPVFYHHITLTTRSQFKKLTSVLEQNPTLQQHVRHLYLEDSIHLSKQEVDMLPIIMPLLNTLYFNPKIWKYTKLHNTWEQIKVLPPLSNYPETFDFIECYGHTLEELTLLGGFISPQFHLALSGQTDKTLLDLVQYTPHIRRLCVYSQSHYSKITLSIHDLVRLHAGLPRLVKLEFLDIALSSSVLSQGPLCPALTMETIRWKGSVYSSAWPLYLAQLYPYVKHLDLDLRWDAQYKQHMAWEDLMQIQDGLYQIATQCRYLEKVHLGDLESLTKSRMGFFEHLQNTARRLTALYHTHMHEANGKPPFQAFKTMLACTHPQKTRSLQFQLWRSLPGIQHIVQPIGTYCTRLTELELNGGPFAYAWHCGCDINVILNHCQQLKKLTLKSCRLTCDTETAVTHDSLVEFIQLYQVHFTTLSLSVLGQQCPRLDHLEMINCVKNRDDFGHKVHLCLPRQRLQRLIVKHLFLRPSSYVEKSGIDTAILAINLTDRSEHNLKRHSHKLCTRWYHLNSHQTKSEHTRQLKKLSYLESEQVKDYTMKEKDWDLLEENSIRGTYRKSEYWESDIPFGYFQVDCKHISLFVFNKVRV